MTKQTLTVIPKPPNKTRAVLKTDEKDPTFVYMKGPGILDFVCGQCGHTLVKGASAGQFPHMIFFCNQCRSYNEHVTDDEPYF